MEQSQVDQSRQLLSCALLITAGIKVSKSKLAFEKGKNRNIILFQRKILNCTGTVRH
jgi:hypothetical protein